MRCVAASLSSRPYASTTGCGRATRLLRPGPDPVGEAERVARAGRRRPRGETAGRGHRRRAVVGAEVGRDQEHAIDAAGVEVAVDDRAEAPQRDPGQPDPRVAARAGRADHVLFEPLRDRTALVVAQVRVDRNDVERAAGLARDLGEAAPRSVLLVVEAAGEQNDEALRRGAPRARRCGSGRRPGGLRRSRAGGRLRPGWGASARRPGR